LRLWQARETASPRENDRWGPLTAAAVQIQGIRKSKAVAYTRKSTLAGVVSPAPSAKGGQGGDQAGPLPPEAGEIPPPHPLRNPALQAGPGRVRRRLRVEVRGRGAGGFFLSFCLKKYHNYCATASIGKIFVILNPSLLSPCRIPKKATPMLARCNVSDYSICHPGMGCKVLFFAF
jgi:hypothetical protein